MLKLFGKGKEYSWESPFRSTFINNENGKDKSGSTESYNSVLEKWKLFNRGEFLYNKVGAIYQKTYVKPNSFGWVNEDRTLYNYDTEGLLAQEVFLNWQDTRWINYQKTNYQYQKDKSISTAEFFKIEKTTGKLNSAPEKRQIYSYDRAGNLIELIVQVNRDNRWKDKFKRVNFWTKVN